MPRPDMSRIPEYFHNYVNQVKENDLLESMINQSESFVLFLKSIPVDKRNYRYAEGKWTIQEMLQHIIDTERIFSYRALCIARKETASLPGFDENEYAANAKAANRKWDDLVEEFNVVRQSSVILFKSFDNEQLESNGTASGKKVYVMGLGFTLVGHINHHRKVIEEKYKPFK